MGDRDWQATMQIGEVAERTGVTQRTLRFYEEKGVLKPPTRMEGGFRLYNEDDVRRVEHVKRLQQLLGFTLAEIKEMVDSEEALDQLRQEYRPDAELSVKYQQLMRAFQLTERQYSIVRQKVDALAAMRDELETKLAKLRAWRTQIEERLRAAASSP